MFQIQYMHCCVLSRIFLSQENLCLLLLFLAQRATCKSAFLASCRRQFLASIFRSWKRQVSMADRKGRPVRKASNPTTREQEEPEETSTPSTTNPSAPARPTTPMRGPARSSSRPTTPGFGRKSDDLPALVAGRGPVWVKKGEDATRESPRTARSPRQSRSPAPSTNRRERQQAAERREAQVRMAFADTRPPPKARPDKPAFKARPTTPPVKKPPVSPQPSSKAKASAASSSSIRPVADRPTMPKARENPRPISTEGQRQYTQWSKGAWIALLKCAHGSINRAKREQIFEWDPVERLMRSLSYVCRHQESRPSDNAWSIRELMELPEIPKKLKNIARKRSNETVPRFQLAQLDIEHKPLLDPLNFMLPLILGVFYNPKNQFEVAIATAEDLERNPEHRPLSEEFVHVGVIMTSEQKAAFATAISDISDGLVFIRAVGGRSKSETIKNTPNAEILNPYNVKFMPDILVHVTPFRNAFSIARQWPHPWRSGWKKRAHPLFTTTCSCAFA